MAHILCYIDPSEGHPKVVNINTIYGAYLHGASKYKNLIFLCDELHLVSSMITTSSTAPSGTERLCVLIQVSINACIVASYPNVECLPNDKIAPSLVHIIASHC